jgi:hypothetical protein
MQRVLIAATIVAALAVVTAQDSATARDRRITGPGVRNAHAMVFDSVRERVVMFGGADAAAVRGDMWTWNGAQWQRDPSTGATPRTFPAMAWDEARREAVLFGGRRVLFGTDKDRNTFLGDTWLLGKAGWRRASPGGPPPRAEAGIAFDTHRAVVVLFGGYNDEGGTTNRLGDTWEWNGVEWKLRSTTGPAARSGVGMAYDPSLRRVVLFGGNGGPRSDTWAWNGTRWEQMATNTVPGVFNSLLAYDAARGQLVRTTGWNGRARTSDTWVLENALWRLVTSEDPPARNHSAVSFDSKRNRLVLFGGHDGDRVFGDVWEWDGSRWSERLSVAPQLRVNNGH